MVPRPDAEGRLRLDVFDEPLDVHLEYLDVEADALRRQVADYVAGDRRSFDVEVAFPASFVGRVMGAMAAIPYGETRTYGDLAADLDTGPRAVGSACGRNPVPVVVPCHRVVRSDGGLGGYSSPGGVALKRRLLDHEAAVARGERTATSADRIG